MTESGPEDHIDRFLARIDAAGVNLDLEVEGIVDRIQGATGASSDVLAGFVAKGMLLNVLAAMDVLYEDSGLPWAERLKEGCLRSSMT